MKSLPRMPASDSGGGRKTKEVFARRPPRSSRILALGQGQGRSCACLEQRCVRTGLRLPGAYLGNGNGKPQAAGGTDNSPAGE